MRGQRGFTLVEILLAAGITGLIMPVLAMSIFQVISAPARVNTALVIQQDIDLASRWFSRDLSQAKTTDLVNGASSVNHARIDWTDETAWAVSGLEAHYVEYTLSGTNLLRNFDGTTSIAGRRVSDIQFSRSGKYITIAITSSLGGKAQTLSYYVTPRADGALQ